MAEVMSFSQLTALFKDYGPFGIVVVMWFFDLRQMRKMASSYRDDVKDILSEHKKYMTEIRQMYENNVVLVDNYESMAKDQKDIIIMNTQSLTQLHDDVHQNQYCPYQRVEKKKVQVPE